MRSNLIVSPALISTPTATCAPIVPARVPAVRPAATLPEAPPLQVAFVVAPWSRPKIIADDEPPVKSAVTSSIRRTSRREPGASRVPRRRRYHHDRHLEVDHARTRSQRPEAGRPWASRRRSSPVSVDVALRSTQSRPRRRSPRCRRPGRPARRAFERGEGSRRLRRWRHPRSVKRRAEGGLVRNRHRLPLWEVRDDSAYGASEGT